MPPIRHDRLIRRALVLVLACAAGLAGAEDPGVTQVSGKVVGPSGEAVIYVEATTRARPNPPTQP